MATTSTATTTTNPLSPPRPSSSRRKNAGNTPRTEIWSNLLRRTREAQARSRRQALQTRHLLVCGGSPEDQKVFVERYVARPPPLAAAQQSSRREQKPGVASRLKGEVRLSNRVGYGYGFVTLYAPLAGGGVGLFGAEAEEVAKVEVHSVPEAEKGYEATLRRLLAVNEEEDGINEEGEGEDVDGDMAGRRAAVCILMSWKEPWLFLHTLRKWVELLSRAVTPNPAVGRTEPPLEVLKSHNLHVTLILQHTDHQELLLRDSYTEESFDYISQSLRTCLLPLSAALAYVPTSLPPQQPGGSLSEVQKALYTALDLNVAALQGKSGKPEATMTAPKHNVVDRSAILVPSGWDSMGKIRLLSETFSPEAVLEGWMTDLSIPLFPNLPPAIDPETTTAPTEMPLPTQTPSHLGPAEVFESTPSPLPTSPHITPPMSPSKAPKSAVADYEAAIRDPNAHKAPKPPEIEVRTVPEQEFLSGMREQLLRFQAQDDAAQDKKHGHTPGGTVRTATGSGATATVGNGEALSELGDVSFNVGGVEYNTSSAAEAIERLRVRPAHPSSGSGAASTAGGDSRSGTPRPGRREGRETDAAGGVATPAAGGSAAAASKAEIPTEELEAYFASLMKKGGGSSTPRKE